MRKEIEQFATSSILEGMTSIRALLHARDAGVNDRPITAILYDTKKAAKLGKNLSYIKAVASKHGYELLGAEEEEIDALAIGNTHGGLIALCGERTLPFLSDATSAIKPNGFYAMIEGIEAPYNFGYAIRSLYACGVDGIILSERNWMTAAGVVARSSAGASELLPIYRSSPLDAISIFKSMGYTTVAADLRTENSLTSTPLKHPLLLVVGGEKRGISRSVLDNIDLLVKIPYASSFNASLSAASAVTMFAYEIMRQNL